MKYRLYCDIYIYIYHLRIYFKIEFHEFLMAGFVLMDCNVSRKG